MGGMELAQILIEPSETMESVIDGLEAELSPRLRRYMLADGRLLDGGDTDKTLAEWFSCQWDNDDQLEKLPTKTEPKQEGPKAASEVRLDSNSPELPACGSVLESPSRHGAVMTSAEPVFAAEQLKRKALEKKLRQIKDLEDKRDRGAELNADQIAKLATKEQVEANLRRY